METEQKKLCFPKLNLKKWDKPSLYPFYAFFITVTAFLLSLLYLDILGFGNNTILRSDLNSQYLPFIQLFLRALKGEESFWYSFSLYYGSGTILNHAYYCFSPFNMLYLIPGISLSAITTIIITLKLGLSAATFQLFVQKAMKQNSFPTVLLATCYALSGYATTMHYQLMWLDAFYMVPIIFWLIIRFVDKQKGLLLTLSFSYLFLLNFYTAYMVGIVSALFFVCYLCYCYFSPNKEAVKKCFSIAFKFAGYILLAVGLSAAILLPAATFLIGHMAQDNRNFLPLLNTAPDIANSLFIGQMQTLDTQVPMLYCGIPVLLILPFYFMNKEIPLKEKICISIPMIFLLLSMMFLPLYKFMHAFDYPNMYGFRFVFLMVFFMVVIACRQLPYMEKVTVKAVAIYSSALLILYSLLIPIQYVYYPATYHTNSQNGLLLNLLFILLWILIFNLFYHKKCRSNLLTLGTLIILIAELSLNSYICIDREEHLCAPESKTNTFNATTEAVVEELNTTDEGFYRIGLNNNAHYNAAAQFGFNGLTTFSSSDDYALRKIMTGLGISTSNRFMSECGFTPLTEMLFNVKYVVTLETNPESSEVEYNGYTISENQCTLPIGYMVNEQIVNYVATDDPFYNQMNLLNLMTGNSYDDIYTEISEEELVLETENMAIDETTAGTYFYHLSDYVLTPSLITYSVPVVEGKTFYACFSQLTTTLSGDSPRIIAACKGVADEVLLSSGCIVQGVPITLYEDSHHCVCLYFDSSRSRDYFCNNTYFYYFNHDNLQKIYADLSPGSWNITSHAGDTLSGTVTATENRNILFTTIPYDMDWVAYVDGKEVEVLSTLNDAFICIVLEPGMHEVTLQYIPNGKDLGLSVTLCSVLILIWLLAKPYSQNKNKKQKQNQQTVNENATLSQEINQTDSNEVNED